MPELPPAVDKFLRVAVVVLSGLIAVAKFALGEVTLDDAWLAIVPVLALLGFRKPKPTPPPIDPFDPPPVPPRGMFDPDRRD